MEYQSLLGLFRDYSRIMEQESIFNPACKTLAHYTSSIYHASRYIGEIARSCLLPRSWCGIFGLGGREDFVNESVGAHTYLFMTMVDVFLHSDFARDYYFDCGYTVDGYRYEQIMEAIRLHDLPENLIGDIPDNAMRDEAKKNQLEDNWYASFRSEYEDYRRIAYDEIIQILVNMRDKRTETGKMLYTADKYSLVIASLVCDKLGHSPQMRINDSKASGRDYEEMSYCDTREDFVYDASEMFTVDIMHIRKIYQYDETGFFTAILVMSTLMVKNHWYDWRDKEYKANS